MDDTEPLFKRLQEYKMVDVYEALGVLALFCGEDFDSKCAFVFRLFDFDNSHTLEKDELIKTIRIVLKGISKVAKIEPPPAGFIEQLADSCFLVIDSNNSGSIDFNEFYTWVQSDYDL
jgi:Ca2+-binding EF-hand superfamily protein